MTCSDAREWFSAWVDEALDARERAEIAVHLDACPECRSELERFTRTTALLRAMERPRAPAGFVDRVLEAARPSPWRRLVERLRAALPSPVSLSAAAVVLTASLAVYVFHHTFQQSATLSAPPSGERGAGTFVANDRQGPAAPPASTFSMVRPSPPPGAPVGTRGDGAPDAHGDGEPSPRSANEAERAERSRSSRRAVPERESLTPSAPEAPRERRAQELTNAERSEQRAAASPGPPSSGADIGRSEPQALSRTSPGRAAAPPTPAMAVKSAFRIRGQLVVQDREAALGDLSRALARLGGRETSKRIEPDGTLAVEVVVPGARYAELSSALSGIGSWEPEAVPAELPAQVPISLRITQ